MQIFYVLGIIFVLFILLIFGMKNFAKIIVFLIAITSLFSFSFAQEWHRWNRWSSPFQVFEKVVDKANEWHDKIQDTAMDWITDLEWSFGANYKISNTLDYVRKHIAPYIQRAIYIWFVTSTTWLIICWFLLVTWWISKTSWFEKVKWKIINALLGVFVLSWFYLIIKLIIWIINTVFWA